MNCNEKEARQSLALHLIFDLPLQVKHNALQFVQLLAHRVDGIDERSEHKFNDRFVLMSMRTFPALLVFRQCTLQ